MFSRKMPGKAMYSQHLWYLYRVKDSQIWEKEAVQGGSKRIAPLQYQNKCIFLLFPHVVGYHFPKETFFSKD